mmetsp:Transcript_36489/g.97144  ORF Transcript_36489/g.97144 Transcript_36489/m.97144 type:complete len:83 (-) Transcript_36489:172-420(-)
MDALRLRTNVVNENENECKDHKDVTRACLFCGVSPAQLKNRRLLSVVVLESASIFALELWSSLLWRLFPGVVSGPCGYCTRR